MFLLLLSLFFHSRVLGIFDVHRVNLKDLKIVSLGLGGCLEVKSQQSCPIKPYLVWSPATLSGASDVPVTTVPAGVQQLWLLWVFVVTSTYPHRGMCTHTQTHTHTGVL